MGGGLMQLVAYGAQDVYLTGNPQITFFKVVYRRHTNFSVESIEQTLNGTVSQGNTVTCNLSRNGDLVNNLMLELGVTCTSGGADRGFELVSECEVEIGGQRIDRQYADWMALWADLTHSEARKTTLGRMVDAAAGASTLHVPLFFWFCRDNGLALPLIALQYHEVKVKVTFATVTDVTALSAKLYADYVYLDTDERRRFAQSSHEYLIEQVQRSVESTTAGAVNKYRLNFNHPVKELVWVTQQGTWADYSDGSSANPTSTAKLVLNGHERFSARSGDYFNWVQPYQHHTGSPAVGVNVYSFALNPEKHQPSGTCNFSRIDNATLEQTTAAGAGSETHIFAHNYNVLRVLSGMGGLAYSN